MIHPHDLIGMKYRLGANPEKHGAADCLTLARAVLAWHGIDSPEGQRSWYRRLRRGDTAVFKDELGRWGNVISSPRIGTVALCQSPLGFGMASYFDGGWVHFDESAVRWSPTGALPVIACYCPTNLICANL